MIRPGQGRPKLFFQLQTMLSRAERSRRDSVGNAKPLAAPSADGGETRSGLARSRQQISSNEAGLRLLAPATSGQIEGHCDSGRLGLAGVVLKAGQKKLRCPGTSRTGRSSTEAKKDACPCLRLSLSLSPYLEPSHRFVAPSNVSAQGSSEHSFPAALLL